MPLDKPQALGKERQGDGSLHERGRLVLAKLRDALAWSKRVRVKCTAHTREDAR